MHYYFIDFDDKIKLYFLRLKGHNDFILNKGGCMKKSFRSTVIQNDTLGRKQNKP